MKYIVGKYYRLVSTNGGDYMNPEGLMDYMLDNRPHKCIFSGEGDHALFEGDSLNHDWVQSGWEWSFFHMEECPIPHADNEKVLSCIMDLRKELAL